MGQSHHRYGICQNDSTTAHYSFFPCEFIGPELIIKSRFLLFQGMTVAGYFPNMIIYISLWYCKKEQTMRIAILYAAGILACAIGTLMVCIDAIYEVHWILK